jgi:hypothetical protein
MYNSFILFIAFGKTINSLDLSKGHQYFSFSCNKSFKKKRTNTLRKYYGSDWYRSRNYLFMRWCVAE